MTDKLYEIPENCDFNNVFNASTHENECSPKLKNKFFSAFSGILINAPNQVVWPTNVSLNDFPPGPWGTSEGPLRLMVAGLIQIQYKTLGLQGMASEHVLLVAVNQETATVYSGKMPKPDVEIMPDFGMSLSEESRIMAEEDALLTNYFNLDLVHDLGIPIAEAIYVIYATLGEYKSNEVIVETKLK